MQFLTAASNLDSFRRRFVNLQKTWLSAVTNEDRHELLPPNGGGILCNNASGRQGFIVESGLKAFRAFDLGFGRKELDEPDGTFPIDSGSAITFKSSRFPCNASFPPSVLLKMHS